jgi:hypothetical protein
MAFGRSIRRGVVVIAVIAAGGFAAIHPDAVKAFYEDLYPSDPAKRQALELCFMQDHKFNRLDSDEREACYHHMLLPATISSGAVTPQQAETNLLDLQRAAGQGSMPRNDIRRLEQTHDAVHASH